MPGSHGTIHSVAFNEKHLHEDEQIVIDLNPHWIMYIKGVIVLVAALIVGVLILMKGPSEGFFNGAFNTLGGLIILVAFGYFVQRMIAWKSTNFVVTTDRCIYREGIISKRGIEIPLERINTIFFEQGALDRMVGAGTLTIESAGENGTQHFTDIKDPIAVQQTIYRQIELNESSRIDRLSGNRGPASVADELSKLADLRAEGLLTDAEFQEQKARLLDQ